MARLTLTVTDELMTALQAEAARRGTPLANLARDYIARGLVQDGQSVTEVKVQWGGKRDTRQTKKHR